MKKFSSLIFILAFSQSCDIYPLEDRIVFGEDIVINLTNELGTDEMLKFKYCTGRDPEVAFQSSALDSIMVLSESNSDSTVVWDNPIPDTGSGFAFVSWNGQFKVLTSYGRALEDVHVDVTLQNDSLTVIKK